MTHSQDKPSVAAVVASMDRNRMVYEEALSIQPLIEPANADGKARKSEIIGEMTEMVKVNYSLFSSLSFYLCVFTFHNRNSYLDILRSIKDLLLLQFCSTEMVYRVSLKKISTNIC